MDITHHDENTMQKVYDALKAAGIKKQRRLDAVAQMQNAGIYFRERQPVPVLTPIVTKHAFVPCSDYPVVCGVEAGHTSDGRAYLCGLPRRDHASEEN